METSGEKIKADNREDERHSFSVLKKTILLTLMIVLAVSGTVSLVLMSDKGTNNDGEKMAAMAKENENYADSLLSMKKEKNSYDKNGRRIHNVFSGSDDEYRTSNPSADDNAKEHNEVISSGSEGTEKRASHKSSHKSGHEKGYAVSNADVNRLSNVPQSDPRRSYGAAMQPGARSSAVNSSSGLQYGSSGMSGTDGKYDGSMDKASSLLDEADGKLKAMGKNARLHSVHSGNIGTRGGANARQQAAAINSMLRSAEDASGSVLARSRMDAAWEGKIADESQTVQGTGIDSGENMVFDPAGQAEKQGSQGFAGVGASGGGNHKEADVPEVSESENVTPWAKELKALKYIFMAAMAMLAIAGALADTPHGKVITIVMSSIAMAMSAAAIGLAITIMAKYKQTALGGMWLAVAGAGLAACAVACLSGIAAYRQAQWKLFSFLGAHLKIFLALVGVGGGLLTGILGAEAVDNADKEEAAKYCKEHPDHSGCKKTSSLPYELRDLPSGTYSNKC